MMKEFKAFLLRGNILDMAVGVMIGAAFTKVVTSFTNDVLMPPIGMLLGKADFSNLYINLSDQEYASLAEAKKAGAATINLGVFANVLLDFVIVAFVIYLVLKAVSRATGRAFEPPK